MFKNIQIGGGKNKKIIVLFFFMIICFGIAYYLLVIKKTKPSSSSSPPSSSSSSPPSSSPDPWELPVPTELPIPTELPPLPTQLPDRIFNFNYTPSSSVEGECIQAFETTGYIPNNTWGTTPLDKQFPVCDALMCRYLRTKYGSGHSKLSSSKVYDCNECYPDGGCYCKYINGPASYPYNQLAAHRTFCDLSSNDPTGPTEMKNTYRDTASPAGTKPKYDTVKDYYESPDSITTKCIDTLNTGYIPVDTWGTTPVAERKPVCQSKVCPYLKSTFYSGITPNGNVLVDKFYSAAATFCSDETKVSNWEKNNGPPPQELYCNTGDELLNTACLTTCPSGYFPDSIRGYCIKRWNCNPGHTLARGGDYCWTSTDIEDRNRQSYPNFDRIIRPNYKAHVRLL